MDTAVDIRSPVDALSALSETELDYLWQLMRGHVPVDRAEFLTALRHMATICRIQVTLTAERVEITIPSLYTAFDR